MGIRMGVFLYIQKLAATAVKLRERVERTTLKRVANRKDLDYEKKFFDRVRYHR